MFVRLGLAPFVDPTNCFCRYTITSNGSFTSGIVAIARVHWLGNHCLIFVDFSVVECNAAIGAKMLTSAASESSEVYFGLCFLLL